MISLAFLKGYTYLVKQTMLYEEYTPVFMRYIIYLFM